MKGMNPFLSSWLTARNMLGGFMKKVRYVEKVENKI